MKRDHITALKEGGRSAIGEKSLQLLSLLFIILIILTVSIGHDQTVMAQSNEPVSSVESHSVKTSRSIYFTTDIQERTPLALFNLLSFEGEGQKWRDAEVELKYSLSESDERFAKRLEQISRDGETKQAELFFPSMDYHSIGRLNTKEELSKPRWIIWLPSTSPVPTVNEQQKLHQIFDHLREYAAPDSQVYLFRGQEMPTLSESYKRAADIKIDALAPSQRSAAQPLTLQPNMRGLGELLSAIHLNKDNLDLSEQVTRARYRCGRSCEDLIPTVRILILHDQPLNLREESSSLHQHIFDSLSSNGHFLSSPYVFFLDLDQGRASIEAEVLRLPTLIAQGQQSQNAIKGGGMNAFKNELKRLRTQDQSTFYVIPPLVIPQYYWSEESTEVSVRIQLGEESFVRRSKLEFPYDGQRQKNTERRAVYQEYRDQIERLRAEVMKPQQLSFMTRIIIGALWVAVCLAVLSVTVIRLRRHRSQTSEPAIRSTPQDQIETEALFASPATPSVSKDRSAEHSTSQRQSIDDALIPEWSKRRDPGEHARNKRRQLERSLRIDQPSIVNPMVNPDDPSTVPAPAAEAKVSDQPSQAAVMESSDAPRPQRSLHQESPIERIEMISAVLSLDSAPPPPNQGKDEVSVRNETTPQSSRDSLATRDEPIAGLYAERGPMRKLFFLIFESSVIVGRNPQNSCPLPPAGDRADRQISREHFELSLTQGERWELRCLSSQGLILNETPISSGESALIKDRDLILIGETHLRFRSSTTWRVFQVKEHLSLGQSTQRAPL